MQVHFFNSPKPGYLVGKLNWRIKEPDGEFFTRDVVQTFDQDPKNPAHLVNKDNEYLHYRGKSHVVGWYGVVWYVKVNEDNNFLLTGVRKTVHVMGWYGMG